MDIETFDGVQIFVLPECAVCKASGENPMYMTECPECRTICIPDECDNYEERWEEAEE